MAGPVLYRSVMADLLQPLARAMPMTEPRRGVLPGAVTADRAAAGLPRHAEGPRGRAAAGRDCQQCRQPLLAWEHGAELCWDCQACPWCGEPGCGCWPDQVPALRWVASSWCEPGMGGSGLR